MVLTYLKLVLLGGRETVADICRWPTRDVPSAGMTTRGNACAWSSHAWQSSRSGHRWACMTCFAFCEPLSVRTRVPSLSMLILIRRCFAGKHRG